MSDVELLAFVTASAAMLDLQLDVREVKAVKDVIRGMQEQIALVVEYVSAEAAA